ncbi:MAG TPA: hypothetical protein PKY19_00545 [Oscillospiraceae bacterium]|nr:hypothetical protein [Oscillospiraceae bacterium]HXK76963.1 hypothetical protein [Oscillospiraceae bacterium]
MNFVKSPNLPEGEVCLAAVSAKEQEIIRYLQSCGIEIVPVPPCEELPRGLQTHPDLRLLHLGSDELLTASCPESVRTVLRKAGFRFLKEDIALGACYPEDCRLNAAVFGGKIIYNPQTTDATIAEFVEKRNIMEIKVRQGYAKCSVFIAAEDAIVTGDPGIAAAAERGGVEVLRIRHPEDIVLEGFDHGFIGGCCGLLEEKLAFCAGRIGSLRDGENLLSFLRNRGIYLESVCGGVPKDIGGILPLGEKSSCV